MEYTVAKTIVILLCLLGFVLSNDDSGSSATSDSSDEDEFSTPPSYFEYKVRGLNTALYYILHALQEDLKDGADDVDISFFKRINAIVIKIKYFYGEIDQTNALMLGEIIRTLPEYLKTNLEQVAYNFNEYTAMNSIETTLTSTPTTITTEITDEI